MCCCVRSVLTRDPDTDLFRWRWHDGDHDTDDCNPTGADNFRITTTFRWTIRPGAVYPISADQIDVFLDGLPLSLHLNRLRSSAHAFGWAQTVEVFQSDSVELGVRLGLLDHMRSSTNYCLNHHAGELSLIKVRITISRDGRLEIQDSGSGGIKPPIYPFNFDANPFLDNISEGQQTGKVALAQTPIETSLFTQRKTTHRPMYAAAYNSMFTHAVAPTTAEVLLYNTSEEITEATVSTVYFQTGDDWITPAKSSGGNLGTTRAWALEKGWCKEGIVSLSDAKEMRGHIVWLSNAVRGFWPARICVDRDEWEHLWHF